MIRRTIRLSWPVVLIFTLLWVMLMIILLQGRLFTSSGNSDWTHVTNEEYNFSVEHPAKWAADTFGEIGSRGDRELKLEVYAALLSTFRIFVYQKGYPQPTPQDVAAWGMTRIEQVDANLSRRGQPTLREIDYWESSSQGQPILHRRYGNGLITFEDVYIARSTDMIIITLQNDAAAFDNSLIDFNRLVVSFAPLQ